MARRRKRRNRSSWLENTGWGVLALALKVSAIAFFVQGFFLQLVTGVIYIGGVHYAAGVILYVLAKHVAKRKLGMDH